MLASISLLFSPCQSPPIGPHQASELPSFELRPRNPGRPSAPQGRQQQLSEQEGTQVVHLPSKAHAPTGTQAGKACAFKGFYVPLGGSNNQAMLWAQSLLASLRLYAPRSLNTPLPLSLNACGCGDCSVVFRSRDGVLDCGNSAGGEGCVSIPGARVVIACVVCDCGV